MGLLIRVFLLTRGIESSSLLASVFENYVLASDRTCILKCNQLIDNHQHVHKRYQKFRKLKIVCFVKVN